MSLLDQIRASVAETVNRQAQSAARGSANLVDGWNQQLRDNVDLQNTNVSGNYLDADRAIYNAPLGLAANLDDNASAASDSFGQTFTEDISRNRINIDTSGSNSLTNNNSNNNNSDLGDILNVRFNRFQNSSRPGTYLFAGEAESQGIRQDFSPPFVEEGEAFSVSQDAKDDLIRFNRFQNTSVPGTYLFASEEESVNIRQNFPNFDEEGIAFFAFGAGANQATPFYRFQNTQQPGTYIFVSDRERLNIQQNFPQFVEEGIAFEAGI